MTTRKDIITTLKDDLMKISVTNGYSTDLVDARVGIVNADKFTTRPAIGLWSLEDEVLEQLLDDKVLRRLNMILYGYIDVTEAYDDYEPLYDFVRDTEKFLYSIDNTYNDDTLILNTKTNYGGLNTPVGIFMILFNIDYYQTDF